MTTHANSNLVNVDFREQEQGSQIGGLRAIMVREGDRVEAEIYLKDSKKKVQAYCFSPLGADFISKEKLEFSIGDKIKLDVHFHDRLVSYEGVLVTNFCYKSLKKAWLFSVRWCEFESDVSLQKRGGKRWICGENFLPIVVLPNPLKPFDFIYMRVTNVSSSGFRLQTSTRNKSIIPGMKLEGMLTFPIAGNASVQFEVIWANIVAGNSKDMLEFGVKLIKPSKHLLRMIGQYAFQFCYNVTLQELKNSGLKISKIRNCLDVDYVRTDKDFNDVLELRAAGLSVYSQGNEKIDKKLLTDHFDSQSRILIVRKHGKCIATARIIFYKEGDKFFHENYTDRAKGLCAPEGAIEIGKAVVDPDYRGSDVLICLIKEAIEAAFQSKRHIVVASMADNLTRYYKLTGIKITDTSYIMPEANNAKITIGYVNVKDLIRGSNINPIIWNLIYRDMYHEFRVKGLCHMTSMDRLRVLFYRLCHVFIWLNNLLGINRKLKRFS